MDERIGALAAKIAVAAKSLGQALTDAEVSTFEYRHGVSLPEGFRSFLLKLGNGGNGPPSYGLVQLGQGPDSADHDEGRYWQQLPNVRLPFPFTQPWCWEDGEKSDEGSEDQSRHGCIFLGTDGCGMDWIVIVNGAERGNVWMVCGEGVTPTVPKRDFLTWYEDWLAGTDNWFAYRTLLDDSRLNR